MEKIILSQFEKAKAKPDHILMMKNLRFSIFDKLNPKQQKEAMDAINSLINKKYIIYEDGKNGPECIRLTKLGFENLYLDSKSKSEIESLIMAEFEKQNSKTGDIVMMRNLNFGLIQNLNPKEIELFEPAVNNLIEKKLITYEKGNLECLRLTEIGYQELY